MTTSWVIIRLDDRLAMFETFNPKIVCVLNTQKYRAVGILDYLTNLNRQIRNGATGTVLYNGELSQ